jgi:antitoxin component YwqK of YwqJK toxin-antitoxin module
MADILNGYYEEKFDNGVIKIKGYYKNGKKDGTWEEYNENGDLILVQIYQEGKQL